MNIEKFVIGLFFILLMGLVFAFPLMWLMNYVFAPNVLLALFGVAKIGYWKTFGFQILTGLLFRRK